MSLPTEPDLGLVPSPSDSGIVVSPLGEPLLEWPASGPPPTFNQEFRQRIAALLREALTLGYVTRREYVRTEAHRRGLSVEELLAAYLTRKIMDRVDDEYV
jgi:hypothetical protein